MFIVLACLLAACASAQQDVDLFEDQYPALSELLERDFSCDKCWADGAQNRPFAGTTDWCLCCFYDCKGFRGDCLRDNAFCASPSRCQALQMCTEWGGIMPAGTQIGKPQTYYEPDGETLKRSAGSPPADSAQAQAEPADVQPAGGDNQAQNAGGGGVLDQAVSPLIVCPANTVVCPTGGDCVHARCETLPADEGGIQGKGSAANFKDVPCSSDADTPCVCRSDPTVRCDAPEPAEPVVTCADAVECQQQLGTCRVHCRSGVCQVSDSDNDNACQAPAGACFTGEATCTDGKCSATVKEAGDSCADECANGICDAKGKCHCPPVQKQVQVEETGACCKSDNTCTTESTISPLAITRAECEGDDGWFTPDVTCTEVDCQATGCCYYDNCLSIDDSPTSLCFRNDGGGYKTRADCAFLRNSPPDNTGTCSGPKFSLGDNCCPFCASTDPEDPKENCCQSDSDCGQCDVKCTNNRCTNVVSDITRCPMVEKGKCGKVVCTPSKTCTFSTDATLPGFVPCPDLGECITNTCTIQADGQQPQCVPTNKPVTDTCTASTVGGDSTNCGTLGGMCRSGDCECKVVCCDDDKCSTKVGSECSNPAGSLVISCDVNTCAPVPPPPPPEPKYGCCLPDGTCEALTVNDCVARKGTRSTTQAITTCSDTLKTDCASIGCCIINTLDTCKAKQNIAQCTFGDATNQFETTLEGTCCTVSECNRIAKEVCPTPSPPPAPSPPPCEEEKRCGERPGCHGGVNDGLLCRTLDDCIGGHKCVDLQWACQDDAPCQDCDENEDDMRAHQCSPCAFCEPVRNEKTGKMEMPATGALDLPCCPYQEDERFAALLTGKGIPEGALPADLVRADKKYSLIVKISLISANLTACFSVKLNEALLADFAGDDLTAILVYNPTSDVQNLFGTQITAILPPTPSEDELFVCTEAESQQDFDEGVTDARAGKLIIGAVVARFESPFFALGGQVLPADQEQSKLRRRSRKCHPTEELDAQGNCRPRLGCSCQNCEDGCDFELHTESKELVPFYLGLTVEEDKDVFTDQLGITPENEFSQGCNAPAFLDNEAVCKELTESACRLRSSSPIDNIIESIRITATTDDELCTDNQEYSRKEHDVYRIYTPDRKISVSVSRPSQTIEPDVGDALYLIDLNSKCEWATAIRPFDVSRDVPDDPGVDPAEQRTTTTFDFHLDTPGDYLIVYQRYEFNKDGTGEDITDEQRAKLRCTNYRIEFGPLTPSCPAELCSQRPFCYGARDCPLNMQSEFACARPYGRCILAPRMLDTKHAMADPTRRFENEFHSTTYHTGGKVDADNDADDWWDEWKLAKKKWAEWDDKPDNEKPKGMPPVCWGAATGTPCIGTFQDPDTGRRMCYLSECQGQGNEACPVNGDIFDCDCQCQGDERCTSDMDCPSSDPHTLNRCTEAGVCVEREIPTLWQCGSYADVKLQNQPIDVACDSDELTIDGTCLWNPDDDSKLECVYEVEANNGLLWPPADQMPTFTAQVCEPAEGKGCTKENQPCQCTGVQEPPVCQRTVKDEKQLFECVDRRMQPPAPTPPAPPTVLASERTFTVSAPQASPAAVEEASAALDAAELAHTAAAFDIYGTYVGERRVAPICSVDMEQRSITVSSDKHANALGEHCDAVELDSACLANEHSQTTSGHQWLDRAWRQLEKATRHAQHREARETLQSACCAQLYYGALADWCGRKGDDADYWQLADARVRRVDSVGHELVAFDDGHRDRDLNDWVAEQRLVEIVASDNSVRAINIHVAPLARGGGYKASYALSLRGTDISSLDSGATAACSERARALLHAAYNVSAITSELTDRKPVPTNTVVAVLHHANADNALPHGVRESQCTTLTEASDTPAYCAGSPHGDVALFDDIRSTLPALHADALDALLTAGVRVDQSTNTKPGTHTVHAKFGASAVVSFPSGERASAASLRFVLRNEDCGAAVLLPLVDRPEPLAVRIPAHSAASFRWAAEGVQLVQAPDSQERVCRGGELGGVSECAGDSVCTSGECAAAPSIGGVPYPNAHAHFACGECTSESACASDSKCRNSACCSDQTLHWYRYPSAELVYQPQHGVSIDSLLANQPADDTPAADVQ